MRMTIQFLVISFLVLPVPILLRLFPVILPPGVLTELNIILVGGAMANSSVNAIIYLKYNDDIRKKAKVMLGMKPEAVTAEDLAAVGIHHGRLHQGRLRIHQGRL